MTIADSNPGRARLPHIMLVAAGFLAVYISAGVALVLPEGLGADEPAHVGYAGFIATHGRLPDLRVDDVYQAQHPPLYYTFMAAVHESWRPFATPRAGGDGLAPPPLLRTDQSVPDLFVIPSAGAPSTANVTVATY